MYKSLLAKFKKLGRQKQGVILGAAVVLIAVIALILLSIVNPAANPITNSIRPERSVAAYCSAYKQEKSRLGSISNNSNAYPSGVFNVTLNDAGQIANSFGKLDPVAPTEIEPQVKTLQKLYQKIQDDPSQAIAASLSGGDIDDSLKAWTVQYCSKD